MKSNRNVLVALGWYDPRTIEGIARFAKEAGWHLEMRATMEGSLPHNWQGDGMLANDTEVPRLVRFIQNQLPLQPSVLIGANHRHPDLPVVQEDNFEVGRLAAAHFLERAHRHFAWFSLQRGKAEADRRQGFISELESRGKVCERLEWHRERGRQKDNWENRREWLSNRLRRLPKPLAMFVLDDLLAIDAVEVCLDLGLKIPEEVSVMGVGNMELACECARISISSVDENLSEISYQAAALLDELMNQGVEKVVRKAVIVPPKGVVMRRSTDSLAVTHPGLQKALAFVGAEFSKNIGIEDVARAAGISLRALQYVFKEELARTPAQHLAKIRLEHSRHWLVSSELPVGAVAQKCGFGTLRHFHRSFVKAYGSSPQAFRQGISN